MSVTHYIDDVAVTMEFPTFPELTTAARGGEQGSGTAVVPDPTGSLDLRGWKRYRAEESACTSRPIIYTGFLKGKKIRRGAEGPRGVGRVWECEFGDLNLIAHLRVLRGSDAKRPAETHAARANWLLAKLATFADFFVDTGYVNLSPTFNLDEADYTGRYADEVLDDIAGTLGWDWFVFWDYTAAAEALFLGLRDAAILTSTLSVSNFAGEANDTTIFSTGHSSDLEDATVDRDPDETYSGLLEKYVGGQIYRTLATTGTTFIERDAFVDSSRVGKHSTALSQADTYLANHAIEKDIVNIPVRLPKAKVNLVAAGERIAVHLEHLAFATGTSYGGGGYVYVRVARRTVAQAELDFYDLTLACTNAPKPGAGPGGGSSGDFPYSPGSAAPDETGDVCNSVIEDSNRQGSANLDTGVLAVQGDEWYFEVQQSSHTAGAKVTGLTLNSSGVVGSTLYDLLTLWTPTEIGTGAGSAALPLRSGTFTVGTQGGGGPTGMTLHVDADYLGPGVTVDECFHIELWRGTSRPVADPPARGQAFGPIEPVETPDGTITTFTLPAGYEFADNSLHVKVAGTQQDLAIVSYDGAARTLTLAFAPKTGWRVQVWGIGR